MSKAIAQRPVLYWVVTLVVGIALGLLIVDQVSAQPEPGPPGGMAVSEQNTDADGNIRIHEQGVADVNVTGGSLDVSVVNGSSDPVPVIVEGNGASSTPVQVRLQADLSDGDRGGCDSFTVPAGQRLVIETISGTAVLPPNQPITFFNLFTQVDGVVAYYEIPVTELEGELVFTDGPRLRHGGHTEIVRLYGDGGTDIRACLGRSGDTGPTDKGAGFTVGISGYLLPMVAGDLSP